ncbi:hypothetical protein H8959_005937 [Pygathrix nigripes]
MRLKMTTRNIHEREVPCDVEMEGFTREAPCLSILGDGWDCENQEGHLSQSALTLEKPGTQEAICEYPGFGEHLIASSDLPPSQRVLATNGFHAHDSNVSGLDCDPALPSCPKSYAAKRTGDSDACGKTFNHSMEVIHGRNPVREKPYKYPESVKSFNHFTSLVCTRRDSTHTGMKRANMGVTLPTERARECIQNMIGMKSPDASNSATVNHYKGFIAMLKMFVIWQKGASHKRFTIITAM